MNKLSLPKFNPKADLPYLAALAQTAQYALAGSILLGNRGWFFGGVMGLLVSVTMAYASSQYDEVAKARKPFVFWGMVAVGILSPIVIGTSMFLDLPAVLPPAWRGIVGAVWGILPDASVALTGFVAGRGLVKQESKPAQVAEIVAPKPRKPEKVAPKKISKSEFVAYLRQNSGASDDDIAQHFGVSRQAINARRKTVTPAELGLVTK